MYKTRKAITELSRQRAEAAFGVSTSSTTETETFSLEFKQTVGAVSQA
jgi:hypothetical protein